MGGPEAGGPGPESGSEDEPLELWVSPKIGPDGQPVPGTGFSLVDTDGALAASLDEQSAEKARQQSETLRRLEAGYEPGSAGAVLNRITAAIVVNSGALEEAERSGKETEAKRIRARNHELEMEQAVLVAGIMHSQNGAKVQEAARAKGVELSGEEQRLARGNVPADAMIQFVNEEYTDGYRKLLEGGTNMTVAGISREYPVEDLLAASERVEARLADEVGRA